MREHERAETDATRQLRGARGRRGDRAVGDLVWTLAEGRDLDDAAASGVAAGAPALLTPATELCRPDDARRLYREVRSDGFASAGADGDG